MNNRTIQMYKEIYKKGTRIECISMDDPYSPIERGTKGTVVAVDDIGTIHMKWDNGRTLGLVPGEDQFKIIKED
jgi:signal recognition particle receptor subunit beta